MRTLLFTPDRWLFLLLNADASTPAWIIELARLFSVAVPSLVVSGLLVAGLLWPRLRPALVLALLAAGLGWLLVRALRSLYPLPRPASFGLGIQWLAHGTDPGFPSMHATVSFALATVLIRMHGRPAIGILLLALGVGWSRVLLGLHFPSDVFGGLLLGVATGWATAASVDHAWEYARRWVRDLHLRRQ